MLSVSGRKEGEGQDRRGNLSQLRAQAQAGGWFSRGVTVTHSTECLSSCRARMNSHKKQARTPGHRSGTRGGRKQSTLSKTGPRVTPLPEQGKALASPWPWRNRRSADLCCNQLRPVNMMGPGETWGWEPFPRMGATSWTQPLALWRTKRPVCQQITNSRPPASPQAPPLPWLPQALLSARDIPPSAKSGYFL